MPIKSGIAFVDNLPQINIAAFPIKFVDLPRLYRHRRSTSCRGFFGRLVFLARPVWSEVDTWGVSGLSA